MTEFFTNQVLIGAGLVVGSVPLAMLLRAAGDYLVMPLTNRFIRAMSTPNPNPTPSDFWGPGGFFDSVGRAGRVVLISNILSSSALALLTCDSSENALARAVVLAIWNGLVALTLAHNLHRESSHVSPAMLNNAIFMTWWSILQMAGLKLGWLSSTFALYSMAFSPAIFLMGHFFISVAGP